ncbi:conserved hypothetical protein (plasmid) [Borreliella afzelii PKo]|uniref:Uncharacterized protein n=1 Tax=Borreliella afzelii (strain PKo) TaxID=390236 RepID=Q0SLD4_BORAP|nr:hypothetical protein BAPKO_3552 [Borreliella afzelii PKo]AEL70577.1 conserved hypothetical protein [Borreliella afzelii PKo]
MKKSVERGIPTIRKQIPLKNNTFFSRKKSWAIEPCTTPY